MFPSSNLSFQVHNFVFKLISMFPSSKLTFKLIILVPNCNRCFQINGEVSRLLRVSKLKIIFLNYYYFQVELYIFLSTDWIWTFEKFLNFFRKTRISRILSNCWWWSGLTLIFEAIRINYMLQFHTCSLFLDFIKWYFVSFNFFYEMKQFRTCRT